MWDYGISILTRNYLDVKMSMTRAIAQLGRAPRLHARQCFFRGVHHSINRIDLIEKSMSYSMDSREQQPDKYFVRSDSGANSGAK